ncbi:hypothetical protein LCGC14_0468010 [marine sediment metagenome]|uniref:Uncharacterized protein n=1 Tax=marine sediment metagenome TaxID=412755 RepID=A0A0F9SIG1_9ZZZZ|nr:hypothetical protein [Methylophaga sp.]
MTEPQFYSHTSTGSKKAIFTFITTFIVCLFLLNNTARVFTGTIFVFAGLFIASVAIAMPFYFLKKKHIKIYSLLSIIEFLVTFFLTVIFFLYFFANPYKLTTIPSQTESDSTYAVKCDEPIPEFTLGMNFMPNKTKADATCSCIWKNLSSADKNLSASIARNNQHDASEGQLSQFLFRLDVVMETCKTELM